MSFPVDEPNHAYVCWEDFFELAKDSANWSKETTSYLTCGFIDSRHTDVTGMEGQFTTYTFDTVDKVFRGEFILCGECVEDCVDYVDWWLATVADEYHLREYGNDDLLVDITKLGREAQVKYRRLRDHKMTTM